MRETELLLEGVSPDRFMVGIIVDAMAVAEMHGFPIEGIPVLRGEGEFFVGRDS